MGRIIHLPAEAKQPQRPLVPATDYPAGAIWESDDGSQWMVVWDEQDHRLMWEQIKTKKRS